MMFHLICVFIRFEKLLFFTFYVKRLPLRLLLRRFADMLSTTSEIDRWKYLGISVRCAQLTEFQLMLVCVFLALFFEKSNTDQTSHVAKLGRYSPSSSSIFSFARTALRRAPMLVDICVHTRAHGNTLFLSRFSFVRLSASSFGLRRSLSLCVRTQASGGPDVRSCNVLAVFMCAVRSRLLDGRRREYVAGVRLCSSISFWMSFRFVQLCEVAGTHARAQTLLYVQPRNVQLQTCLHMSLLSRGVRQIRCGLFFLQFLFASYDIFLLPFCIIISIF